MPKPTKTTVVRDPENPYLDERKRVGPCAILEERDIEIGTHVCFWFAYNDSLCFELTREQADKLFDAMEKRK